MWIRGVISIHRRLCTTKWTEKFPIAIPSIGEQQRIVSILDKFDALVNDLSVGLPAELNARRQQYEYFRDRLVAFPEAAPELRMLTILSKITQYGE
jgi:hypothetical protein